MAILVSAVVVVVFGVADRCMRWHIAEQFLIRDSRFALNGPEGLAETRHPREVAGRRITLLRA